MPVILRNNTNSIEIDVNPNLKYTVSKGGFDVIYEDSGDVPMVFVAFRTTKNALIENSIRLDWRDTYIEPGTITFSNAEELRDTLLEWNVAQVRVIQDVMPQPGNSSTSNLTADSTFTGEAALTLGVNSIQVSLKTDQNCLVYIDQSPDGSNWDLTDEYEYFSSINNFGLTVQAINSYYRVRVTNISSASTTYFRLESVLCPVADPLPRSLDEHGHLKTAIKSIQDLYGFGVENTPIGEMRTVTPVRLVGGNFEGTTLDPNFWTGTIANNGTITQANSKVVLATAVTSANGSATLVSVRRGRYVGGSSMVFRSVVTLSAGAANNKRRWGIGFGATLPTITDGAYFQLDGSEFSIVTLKGTSETKVASGSFNGTLGGSYTPGTSVKTYEIYWTNSKVYFVVGDEILHTVSASTDTWANTMSMYIFMDSVNSGGAQTNNTLSCRVATIRRLGSLDTQTISKYQAGQVAALVLKYGSGNLHGMVISGVNNNSVITLYDNTAASGTVLWSSGAMGALTQPFALDFHKLPFSIGLTLAITAANSNATIIYE